MARSPIFDGVDPQLLALIQQVAGGYAPYKTNITSGYRSGDPRFHGQGRALDVQLIDPKTGVALDNYQDPTTASAYQQFANAIYNAASPEMQAKLRWGGYFKAGGPGSYGALDLMHFDTGGDTTPMAGGSWAGGFNDAQAKLWNMKAGGGIGGGIGGEQMGPAMPAAKMDYTPEQRRQAIASIESAGSGDYGALGQWISDPKDGRDRAYGRYQMMGRNIPVWSKQVLGREVTTEEFMRDPKIQDAIFDKIFGDYVQKYGERGAASMWFTGSPNEPNRSDPLGKLTGKTYTDRYLQGLGGPLKMGESYPTQTTPAANGGTPVAGAPPTPGTEEPKDKFAAGFSEIAKSAGEMFGAGGGGKGGGQIPIARAQAPVATTTYSEPGQTLNPQAADAQRQKLAMALQRLNAGKLWV